MKVDDLLKDSTEQDSELAAIRRKLATVDGKLVAVDKRIENLGEEVEEVEKGDTRTFLLTKLTEAHEDRKKLTEEKTGLQRDFIKLSSLKQDATEQIKN